MGLPERQKWLEHALQGLAFWIGHRHSLFKDYPLSEGALVAEACNLIQANLPHDLVLMPECMYKNLVAPGSKVRGVGPLARADLVLCAVAAKTVGREGNLAPYTKFVIEVKRGDAIKQLINEDLYRLHSFLKIATKGTRGFPNPAFQVVFSGLIPFSEKFVANECLLLWLKCVAGFYLICGVPNTNKISVSSVPQQRFRRKPSHPPHRRACSHPPKSEYC